MRQAIVAIEDARFYQHGAIDFRGTVRALVNDLQHKSVQGGSTLAQQYVKNVEILSSPNPEAAYASATAQTVGRKIRELRMAVQVEHTMSRDQILAGYLNAAFFGNQSYGIEVAAQRYFSTSAAKLTLPQAAMLAGIVENPSLYNPLGTAAEVQTTWTRRNTVLARMAQLHYISASAAAAAEKTKLDLNPSPPQSGCTSKSAKYAAYLCDYVVAVIRHDTAYKQVWNRLNGIGGLTITTTLDPKDQQRGQPRGQLHGAAAAQLEQPGRERGHRGAHPAGHRPGPGDRHRPAVRQRQAPQPRSTMRSARSTTAPSGVQIGSAGKVCDHGDRAGAGHPVRIHQDVEVSATVSAATPTARASRYTRPQWQLGGDPTTRASWPRPPTRSTRAPPHRSTCSSPTWSRRSASATSVKTAAQMGLTWPDGKSLLKPDRREGHTPAARTTTRRSPSAPTTSPRCDVAAADATLPARGIYCSPVAITKIVTDDRAESAGGVGPLPPGAVPGGRRRGQLHPAGRPDQPGTATSDKIGRPRRPRPAPRTPTCRLSSSGYTPQLAGRGLGGQPAAATLTWSAIELLLPAWAAWVPCTAPWHRATPGRARSCTRAAGLRAAELRGAVRPPARCSPLARAACRPAAEAPTHRWRWRSWWRRWWRWRRRWRWRRPQRQRQRQARPRRCRPLPAVLMAGGVANRRACGGPRRRPWRPRPGRPPAG